MGRDVKITLWEKISINRYTPLDLFAHYILRHEKIPNFESNSDFPIWNQKVEDYKDLLRDLSRGHDKKIVDVFAKSVCGRIQLRHAVDRGLIEQSEYERAKRENSLDYFGN